MGAKGGKQSSNEVRQWVKKVLNFSSQYNSSSWSAQCVIGSPRVYPQYGDLHGAWATKVIDANQFIEIEFEEKLYITEVNIYETYHAGAVKSISARDTSTNPKWITIWETDKVQDITQSRIFSPSIPKVDFPTNQLRIVVDMSVCGTWSELDAIEMVGTRFNFAPPPPPYDLADDFARLVNTTLFSDVSFLVGGRTFYAHKAILVVRSDFFRAMFCDNMKESSSQEPLELKGISADAFMVLLNYLYTNKIPHETDCLLLVDVWRVADLLVVDGLKSLAVIGIMESLDIDNVIDMYIESSSKLPVIDDVKTAAMSFMKSHMKYVVRQPSFKNLDQNTMVELIQCMTEDMSISESKTSKATKKK